MVCVQGSLQDISGVLKYETPGIPVSYISKQNYETNQTFIPSYYN